MSWWIIGLIALGTFGFRISGPVLRDRIHLSPRAVRMLGLGATALLVSLAATQAVYSGDGFAGWARVLGVAVAGVLIWRRAPFVVIVVGAATVTALLRLAGVT
ncbi:AzlD domain-containing protein [Rhodococcus globerulus]|uniref:Branched-subunit amino acid transport protein AzlD n=2 Tax=Nocardiaceae TaxID=85025 RepID=A0A652YJW2_NOCGL|nr:AzlD domain-containing protein [Rhodococcus globerulus]MDV6265355.1 AzlD domain-containing protein [Rhodococcus globerulus]NMD61997.1 AzlD domain-containing protein [Nocardia globerula]PVX65918.1 branched-subunit amino acid transport protein AzlD [Rhodococcus globerulus]